MRAFRGGYTAKVDEKGRLKLPSAFKDLLDEEHVTKFYITSEDGDKAQVWPLPTWEKREAKLADDSNMNVAVDKYLELTSFYGHEVEIDPQGRVLLPQKLRGKAKLEAEVSVSGKLEFLQVENMQRVDERIPGMTLTAENRQTLAAILKQKDQKAVPPGDA
jgi:MraZ protein